MYSPLLTLEQLAAIEYEKECRYLDHLNRIQSHMYREERQRRIERIEQRIKEYNDEHK